MRHQLAGEIVSRADPLSLDGAGTAEGLSATVPHGGHLSLATSAAAIDLLGEKWRELQKDAAPHQVFQSFEWCSSWARFYAKPEYGVEPCVVTGYQDRKLVFVWPLMKMKVGPFTLLRWLSDPFGQYGDVLIARKTDARPWMAGAMDLLQRLKGIDVIRLRHVRNDAAAFSFLSERFKESGDTDTAPFLDLTAYPDESAYERRYSKDQRKRRKKIRKTLETFGPVEFQLLEPGAAMDKSIDEAIVSKRAWLKERGLYSKPLVCPLLKDFLSELSRIKGNGAVLVASRLTAGARTISWEIGMRFASTHFGFITAHDTSLTDASPARLHMDLSQRRAIKDGMRRFDLMVPGDPHKESWSSGQMAVREFYTPLSFAGSVYARAYLRLLRPVLQWIYVAAPRPIRSYFTSLPFI
jgi:CelD/BcsL family acetyltransferase involved in cellulose biosynthesis